MVKRIPESLVNMAKRFRSTVDDCRPDDALSVTFSPAKLGPSVDTDSLHEESVDIPEYVVQSNESCADDDGKVKAMEYEEGLPKLLFEDLQSDNPGTVAFAARAIGDLLSVQHPMQEQVHEDFLALGGHSTLLHTMRKWTKVATIQSELAHCVARMVLGDALWNKDSNNTLIASFLKMGGLHEIYRAMVGFSNSAAVQANGMSALANLCSGNDKSEDEGVELPAADVAKHFVLNLEGVPLVTNAMKTFPEEEMVQEHGCWLLNNLCRAGGREEASVIKSKALMVVAASVQYFPNNESIEKDAHDLMNAVLSGEKKKES